jgi:hypothetical protein
MRALKNIIHIMLILAILSMGLPIYQPGDANRDERVDLADAVLSVQVFERSADDPAAFVESVRDVVSTLYIVAGLKKVIKSERTANSNGMAPSLENPYLISSFTFPASSDQSIKILENNIRYQSITIKPLLPPPRYA